MTPRRRFCPKGHDTFEVGRDSSCRCRRCKLDTKTASRKRATEARLREAEAIAAERSTVAAAQEKAAREREARREREAQRRREAEYRRAIEAGGAVAANARWERLYEETLDATGSRWGLCQWEDEDANGDYLGRRCTRRTADVYCWRHNRQLERECAARKREGEADEQSVPPEPEPEIGAEVEPNLPMAVQL